MRLLEKAGAGVSFGYVAIACAALLVVSAPAARAQLRMSITFSPARSESTAPLAVSLLMRPRPRADSVLILQLPNEWAGRTRLFRNIVDLGTPTRGARIDATDRPDRVRLIADPRRDVVVTWRVKATPPTSSDPEGHNHSDVERAWAQLVGYEALVLPALGDGTPVTVDFTFRGFDRNAIVATSFGAPSSSPGATLTARTRLGNIQNAVYDIVATPGAVRSYRSTIAGGAFTILIRGHLSIDDSTLVSSVRRVVDVERGFWRTPSPPNYLVSIGVAPRGNMGGQRLANAFVVNIDSTRHMDDDVLALFAHELMHDWIGSGVLSASPKIPDGSISWFTEGFTEFATHRVMRAAGLLSDSDYLEAINHALVEHAISTARDSSWTAIVDGRWRDGAMQREPYIRGELIGLELDAAMLRATNGRVSLDSTLRRLAAQRDRFPDGFTQETLMEQLGGEAQTGSAAARAIVEPFLAGGPIALSAEALGDCVTPTMVQRTTWDPGFDIDASIAARRVVGARPGGPAASAGLRDSMAILGVDISRGDPARQIRLRVRAGTDTTRIAYLPAGPPMTVQQWSRTPGCVP
jgi:predicted metalloprotease with PDZ domain